MDILEQLRLKTLECIKATEDLKTIALSDQSRAACDSTIGMFRNVLADLDVAEPDREEEA